MSNRRRVRQPSDGPIEVMHFKTSADGQEGDNQKFQPLFTINDEGYDLWINPPASVGLTYLKMCRTEGTESAAVWLLEQMIGEDGYEALMNYPELDSKDLDKLLRVCKDYSMGDGPKNG